MMNSLFTQIDNKLYMTAQAHIVSDVDEMPREMAFAMPAKTNPAFMFVAGRYVQGNKANKNGHYWSLEDLEYGEPSIQHTPLNTLHDWNRPVGTFIQTKIVHRLGDNADQASEGLPEIQALAAVWAASFPETALLVRGAHEEKKLFFSMECVSESTQCLTCEETFEYQAAFAKTACAHLNTNAAAPRRFIKPTFLGGALIYPPMEPAWLDANITEVAQKLTDRYAHRNVAPKDMEDVEQWEAMMQMAVST
jgi:hypothetical protein